MESQSIRFQEKSHLECHTFVGWINLQLRGLERTEVEGAPGICPCWTRKASERNLRMNGQDSVPLCNEPSMLGGSAFRLHRFPGGKPRSVLRRHPQRRNKDGNQLIRRCRGMEGLLRRIWSMTNAIKQSMHRTWALVVSSRAWLAPFMSLLQRMSLTPGQRTMSHQQELKMAAEDGT
jgi:hypothetical protein